MTTTPVYRNAQLLISHGIAVAPTTTTGRFISSSSRSLADLATWNRVSGRANYRVQAGKNFGIAALEIRDDAFEVIADKYPPLPLTWRVAKRQGHSYWLFKCEHNLSLLKRARCNDTIMVCRSVWVPGSKNKRAEIYNWVPGCDPNSIPLATLPLEWVAILRKTPKRT